jgi:LmbE family N-acetylglucosaminyl deacetylase
MNTNTHYPIPKIAMSIHAHPDDQEFSAAGTLARWAREGCQVISVTLTDGDAGNNDPDKDGAYKKELAQIRIQEQLAANQAIGVSESIFLHCPDGELQPSLQLRKELTRLIRKYKPEVVISGDPTAWFYGNSYINHPDHRAAAVLACDAVFPASGTRLIFADLLEEGLLPHNVKRLYLHGSEKPDTWVDITSTMDVKVEALKKHASQIGDWDVATEIKKWATDDGKQCEMVYAESYRVMVLVEE